jgi:hypothetical protein
LTCIFSKNGVNRSNGPSDDGGGVVDPETPWPDPSFPGSDLRHMIAGGAVRGDDDTGGGGADPASPGSGPAVATSRVRHGDSRAVALLCAAAFTPTGTIDSLRRLRHRAADDRQSAETAPWWRLASP